MFEDIIEPKPENRMHPSAEKIFEVCSTCEHAEVGKTNPRIFCTIASGQSCANNLKDPFCKWKERS